MRHQVVRKRHDGRCFFCGESCYEALECHRLVPGESGGRYEWANTLTLCGNCHNKVTAGVITVHARRMSTAGPVIHCTVGGKELFLPEWGRHEGRRVD